MWCEVAPLRDPGFTTCCPQCTHVCKSAASYCGRLFERSHGLRRCGTSGYLSAVVEVHDRGDAACLFDLANRILLKLGM